jgi:hypothetical protein
MKPFSSTWFRKSAARLFEAAGLRVPPAPTPDRDGHFLRRALYPRPIATSGPAADAGWLQEEPDPMCSEEDWRICVERLISGGRPGPLLILVASFEMAGRPTALAGGEDKLRRLLKTRVFLAFPDAFLTWIGDNLFAVARAVGRHELPDLQEIARRLAEPLDGGPAGVGLKVSLGCLLSDDSVTSVSECLAKCASARAIAERQPGPAVVFHGIDAGAFKPKIVEEGSKCPW